MNIHHATVKAAAAKGITLTGNDEDGVTATSGEREFTFQVEDESVTDTAKAVWARLADILAFEAETPGVQIEQRDGDYCAIRIEDGADIACDPDYDDLLVTVREALSADEGAEAEDGEEPEVRSVVPDRYKKEYAARGHPAHCGDWLANVLNARVLGENGLNVDLMLAVADANGLDARKWLSGTRGWQGRFRMTSRNALAKIVAVAGVLHVPAEANNGEGDVELEPPAAWVAEHTPKAKGKAAVQA